MVRCTTNIAVMYVEKGFSGRLLFAKTHYYNKQLILHEKVNHNIPVMENEIVSNQYVKVT